MVTKSLALGDKSQGYFMGDSIHDPIKSILCSQNRKSGWLFLNF
jgi:hypothetical protein